MRRVRFVLPILAAFTAVAAAFANHTTPKVAVTAQEWFIYNSLASNETVASNYTLDEDYNPETSGCGTSPAMCAVLALNNGSDQPILNISGGHVTTGASVTQIQRKP